MASSATVEPKPRSGPVRSALERLISSGEIEADPLQRRLADQLDALDRRLSAEIGASKKSALGWLFGKKRDDAPVKGLYVHGDVGRGKTMLMDMFFRQSSIAAKRRVHFHAFMGEVHERIGEHRRERSRARGVRSLAWAARLVLPGQQLYQRRQWRRLR